MLRRLVPIAAVLALVVAGCGDSKKSSSTTTSTTTSTTSAQYTGYKLQVQAVLGSVGTAGSTLGASARSSKSPADLARALEAFKASVEQAANSLAKLNAPPTATEGQRELEQVLREIAAGVQPAIEAARAGDRVRFRQTFTAYQRKLDGEYRQRLTAAGSKIDRALAGK
jgi:L,D-peptidoglycan transpeptidase YkuD (ErfK/YbiS/YcfS/YnhG family)